MPIPTPRRGEDEDTFMSRCMSSDTMNEDYPDQEQRAAVCFRQWREAHEGKEGDETTAARSAFYQMPVDEKCWSSHLGLWCIEPLWFMQAVSLYKAGLYQPQAAQPPGADPDRRRYDVDNHVALVPLMGPMTKGFSKFGGSSTALTRRALRHAARNDEVHGIILHVDSPGGHVAGVQELADDVARIATRKPTVAHIDDLGASAAYWVASQAGRITANATAEIGSIGTMAVLEDTSKRLERLGVAVHVLATGPYKGIGVEGAPVSPEALDYLQRRVHAINSHFLASVQRGRHLSPEHLGLVSDGKVHLAREARQLGLIDAVQSLEMTLEEMAHPGPGVPAPGPRQAGVRVEDPNRMAWRLVELQASRRGA